MIVHGITVGIPTSIKYMRMFLDRGWNVLMYNQRRHGASEGKYSTYGYYEKYDLDLWVNWVVNRNGEDGIIGLHGESMGAATVLQYADINKYVDFIIADCAYSDMNELMKFRIKEDIKLPAFPMLKFVELKSKRRARFSFKDVSPINSIKYNEIPVLFIHGKNDKFVPTYMSEKMYEVKKGMKRIYLADGAAHACSIEVDKQKYEEVVFEFINEVEANLGKSV
ncbi:alpha/beta hydrolase [Clostridium tepidiprofundi]|nr:alpha/beta hydrolase [Clostridium tepidiprofundi]